MSAYDRKVTIVARRDPTKKHGYDFDMMVNDKKEDRIFFFKDDEHDMKKTDYFRIKFKLKNGGEGKDKANLKFSRDLKNVMWINKVQDEGEPCPTSPCYLDGEIWVEEVDDDELKVVNMDMTKFMFKFTLNFLDRAEQDSPTATYIDFDPIGENRNGGAPGG